MKLLLTCLIILWASSAFANPLVLLSGSPPIAGESNIMIAGDETTNTSTFLMAANELYYLGGGYTANAQTSTLRYGYAWLGAATTATSTKMCVYQGTTQVECATATWVNGMNTYTFSGTHTIAGGATVNIGIIPNGSGDIATMGGTWSGDKDSSGSYTTPSTTLASAGGTSMAHPRLSISNYAMH